MKKIDTNSVAHTTWNRNYHIVFPLDIEKRKQYNINKYLLYCPRRGNSIANGK